MYDIDSYISEDSNDDNIDSNDNNDSTILYLSVAASLSLSPTALAALTGRLEGSECLHSPPQFVSISHTDIITPH